jgi:uncharacterized protein YeaO (DUF488 family)
MLSIEIKRVYEPVDVKDGKRILIDRLWPRGVSKENAKIDLWLKDISPSTELRKWFKHIPEKWPQFRQRYSKELEANKQSLEILLKEAQFGPIVLVYAAKDEKHNDAVVLRNYLKKHYFN